MEGDRSLVALVSTVLYPLLVKEPKAEAERAAEALGGMGQQFLKLDDEPVMRALQHCGRERLTPVRQLHRGPTSFSPAPSPRKLANGGKVSGDRLHPSGVMTRFFVCRNEFGLQGTTLAYLCGQGANRFLKPEVFSSEMRCLETTDLEHLFLLRVRGGLTASTLIFPRGNNDETLLSPNPSIPTMTGQNQNRLLMG